MTGSNEDRWLCRNKGERNNTEMNGMLQKEHKPPVLDGIRTQLVLPPWPFAKSREEPCSTVHEEVQFFLLSQSNKDIIGLASNNSLKSLSVFEPYLLRFLPDFLSILCDFGDIEDSTFFWRLRRKAQIRTCSDTPTHTRTHWGLRKQMGQCCRLEVAVLLDVMLVYHQQGMP